MAFTDQDAQAEIDGYKTPVEHSMAAAPVSPLLAAQAPPPATTTPTFLDSVLSHTDRFLSHYGKYAMDSTRDVAAGLTTGLVNAADSVKSAVGASGKGLAAAEDPANASGGVGEDADKREEDAADPFTPVYNDARQAALNVRDAIAVKNPGVADHLLEGAGQLVPSFLMFSRVLGGIHGLADLGAGGNLLARSGGGVARFAAADTPNSTIMQGPHDPRLADTLQLLRHSEGKFGDMLRAVTPDGSAMDHYVNYLADHSSETEAEGRYKNVLDSYGAGAAMTGIMHSAAGIFKQGWNALHFMADKGMGAMSDVAPKPQLQDMSLTPEQRATERLRVAAERDAADPNPGSDPTAVDNGIPTRRQAEVEGEAARRDREAAQVAALPVSGTTASKALTPGDVHNNAVTSMVSRNLQKQNAAGGTSSLADTVENLHAHLDESTPSGAFYKDLLGRIKDKNLDTTIVPSGTGKHKAADALGIPNAGSYLAQNDTAAFHPDGLTGGSDKLLHTVSHEAVHAVTFKAIQSNPEPFANLLNDMKESNVVGSLKKADRYGLTNPLEMTAEAEANPRFRAALKEAPSKSGSGSLWDDYKKLIGGALGVGAATAASPLFDKLLTKEKT